MVNAVKEVGGPSFFALLVIAVSFLPVLTLEAQEGRLFKPLAYTKNFSMIVAAVLAITLDPALRLLLLPQGELPNSGRACSARWSTPMLVGKIHSEEKHPISRILMRLYEPVCAWSLRWKWVVIAGALADDRGHGSGVPEAGLGIHAAAGRRRAALHADHAAGHFGYGGAAADAGAGPDSDELSRKSPACWARRAARRRPPIRRRSR